MVRHLSFLGKVRNLSTARETNLLFKEYYVFVTQPDLSID